MAGTEGRIVWDKTGERLYETGVDRGVLYTLSESGNYENGVPWNGLTTVTESPSGAEPSPYYADNIKYLNLVSAEDYNATIEAYTFPKEFELCDGSAEITVGVVIGQQTRKTFGFCYRTLIGNDIKNTDYGYKIHIVYGALASPSEKAYSSVNESPEAVPFSWEISTTPVNVTDHKPTATLTIDSTKVEPENLKSLEDILYGTDAGAEGTPAATAPRLPLPDEIAELLASA